MTVDLDENDVVAGYGAGGDVAVLGSAERHGLATQRERVAERCQRLVGTSDVTGLEQRRHVDEGGPPIIDGPVGWCTNSAPSANKVENASPSEPLRRGHTAPACHPALGSARLTPCT
jgi:hypothetical protein